MNKDFKENPLISILFCSSDGEYLDEVIPKIKDLKYPNIEIICVWTGQEEKLLKIKKKLKDINIVQSPVYRSKNFGTNYGVREAKGSYILLLDDDIVINDKDLLVRLLKHSLLCKNFGCSTLTLINKGENIIKSYGCFFGSVFTKNNKTLSKENVKSLNGCFVGHPSGAGVFIKKDVWNDIGGYDEQYIFGGDDSDLGIKLWISGYKCYLFSETIQTHIGISRRSDNKKYAIYYADKLFAHLGVITKNYSFINLIYTLPLYFMFMLIKSIKQSISRKSIGSIIGFLKGTFAYLKNLGRILKDRHYIQSNRLVKKDVFLDIKLPKTNE